MTPASPNRSLYETASRIAALPRYIKRNVVTKRGLSGAYLYYRIARPVLKSLYKMYKVMNPVTPWTSQAAIRIFDEVLRKDMIGFEYGSGNSTVYFAGKIGHLTSVEHDWAWSDIVSKNLKKRSLKNVDYRLVPANPSSTGSFNFHERFGLKPSDFTVRTEYADYFSFIATYPDKHFDFIMVDGRARVECCLNAIPKLKSGGIFVLDNSDRPRYRPVFKVLDSWKKVHTTTGLFDTTFWFKP